MPKKKKSASKASKLGASPAESKAAAPKAEVVESKIVLSEENFATHLKAAVLKKKWDAVIALLANIPPGVDNAKTCTAALNVLIKEVLDPRKDSQSIEYIDIARRLIIAGAKVDVFGGLFVHNILAYIDNNSFYQKFCCALLDDPSIDFNASYFPEDEFDPTTVFSFMANQVCLDLKVDQLMHRVKLDQFIGDKSANFYSLALTVVRAIENKDFNMMAILIEHYYRSPNIKYNLLAVLGFDHSDLERFGFDATPLEFPRCQPYMPFGMICSPEVQGVMLRASLRAKIMGSDYVSIDPVIAAEIKAGVPWVLKNDEEFQDFVDRNEDKTVPHGSHVVHSHRYKPQRDDMTSGWIGIWLTLVLLTRSEPKYKVFTPSIILHMHRIIKLIDEISQRQKHPIIGKITPQVLCLLVPDYLDAVIDGYSQKKLMQTFFHHYLDLVSDKPSERAIEIAAEKKKGDYVPIFLKKKTEETNRQILRDKFFNLRNPHQEAHMLTLIADVEEKIGLLDARIAGAQKLLDERELSFTPVKEKELRDKIEALGKQRKSAQQACEKMKKYCEKEVESKSVPASLSLLKFDSEYSRIRSIFEAHISNNELKEAEILLQPFNEYVEQYKKNKAALDLTNKMLQTQVDKLTEFLDKIKLLIVGERKETDKAFKVIDAAEQKHHAHLEVAKRLQAELVLIKEAKAAEKIASKDFLAEKAAVRSAAALVLKTAEGKAAAPAALISASAPSVASASDQSQFSMFKFKRRVPDSRLIDRMADKITTLTITDELDVLEKAIDFSLRKSTILDPVLELTIQRDVMLVICARLLEILASAHQHLPLLNQSTEHVRDVIFCHEEDLLNPITEHNCAAIQDKMGGVMEMASEIVGCLRAGLNKPSTTEDKTEIVLSSPLFQRWLKQDIQKPTKENRHQYVRSLEAIQPKLEALHGHIDADLLRYAIDAQKAKIDKYQQNLGKFTQSKEDRDKAKALRHGRTVAGSRIPLPIPETVVADFPALPSVVVATSSRPRLFAGAAAGRRQHKEKQTVSSLPSGPAVR